MISNRLYPETSKEISEKRTALAPEIGEGSEALVRQFSKTVLCLKKQNNLLL